MHVSAKMAVKPMFQYFTGLHRTYVPYKEENREELI